ncbi:MAG: ATP-binding cassette domain-containing protein [Candidatus Hydrogenedentota bacterium]
MTREESGRPKALLEVENVTIAAGGQTLLRNVTLMLDAGEIVAVQGPSGCGKTTLLRVIAGLTDPSEGVIRFDGQLREEMTWPLYRRRFPLMEQQSIMIGGTVRDNLKGPFRYASANGAAYDEKTARALFQRLCLEEAVLDQPGSQLSVGQRQRVALVRALLLAPRAVMLDEPTSALDHDSAVRTESLLSEYAAEQGLAVLAVSHQAGRATEWAHRVFDVTPYRA